MFWARNGRARTAGLRRLCASVLAAGAFGEFGAESSGVLALEITEENSEGRRSERRLVLERR